MSNFDTTAFNGLLEDLELLVEAIEQSMTILTGSIATQGNAGELLRQLVAAEGAMQKLAGPNAWRDRLMAKMTASAAQKARAQGVSDPALQGLVASVLATRDQEEAQKKETGTH